MLIQKTIFVRKINFGKYHELSFSEDFLLLSAIITEGSKKIELHKHQH